MKSYFIYLMTNRTCVVLYIGLTNNLERRVWQHQSGTIEGFTKRYRLRHLVYYETFHDVRDALARETELKAWRRSKKNALVATKNPTWADLSRSLFERP